MPDSVLKQLTDLLNKSADEHHEYEKSVLKGVYDEEWPAWYAAWLVEHGINDLLNSQLNSAELTDLLTDINNQHQQTDRVKTWAEYTAEKLIDTASGGPVTNARG